LFHGKEDAGKRNHYSLFQDNKKKPVGKADNVPPTPGKEEASVAHSSSREISHWAGWKIVVS
jgi:hypothetical protein